VSKVGLIEEHWRQIYKSGVPGAILAKSKWNLYFERLARGEGRRTKFEIKIQYV